MRSAYQTFRRRFSGPGRYAVSGALVWQLNDCWPVSSWAIIDSRGIAKPAYYAIKREMAALTVGIRRQSVGAGSQATGVHVWVCSSGTAAQSVRVELFAYSLDGTLLAQESRDIRILPGRSTPLGDWQGPKVEDGPVDGAAVYYAALSLGGEVVARCADFPEPYKYHRFAGTEPSDSGLHAELLSATTLRLSASRPAKGVWIDAGVRLDCDDNFIDLRPGEARTVTFSSLNGLPLSVRALDIDPTTISLHETDTEEVGTAEVQAVGGLT